MLKCVTLVVLCLVAVSYAEDDSTRSIKHGDKTCAPLSLTGVLQGKVSGTQCPDHSWFHYYRCCGQANGECCMHLQNWIMWMIIVFVVLTIINCICSAVNCCWNCFCGRRRD